MFDDGGGQGDRDALVHDPEQASASKTRSVLPAISTAWGRRSIDLLTGRPPFGDTALAVVVVRRVAAGDFPRPRQVQPQTHRALEAICLKAMALRPEDRYPTARAWPTTSAAGSPTSRSRPGPNPGPTGPVAGWDGIEWRRPRPPGRSSWRSSSGSPSSSRR